MVRSGCLRQGRDGDAVFIGRGGMCLRRGAGNYPDRYPEALYLGTPKAQLANPEKPKTKEGFSPKDIARMEQEMEALEHDFKAVDESYGENVLNLTLARGYTKKLLENARVAKFLRGNILTFSRNSNRLRRRRLCERWQPVWKPLLQFGHPRHRFVLISIWLCYAKYAMSHAVQLRRTPNSHAMAGCQRNGAGSGGRGGSVSNVSSNGTAPGYSAAAAVSARTSRV